MKRLVAVVLVATVALSALVWSQQREGPFFVSGFIEAEQARVGSRVGGRVAQVHVTEGQRVSQGAPLVTLEPFDLNERLAEAESVAAARQAVLERLRAGARAEEIGQARARRDRAQAVLDKLIAGPRPLEVSIAEDKVALARADLDKAKADFQRVERLFKQGQAADEEMTAATRAIGVAQARFEQAEHDLALLKEGARKEDVAEARGQLEEATQFLALLQAGARREEIAEAEAIAASARASVAAIRQQLAELVVSAPAESAVESIDLEPGDLIAPNAPVVTLVDESSLWVRAFVPENRLNIRQGHKVAVRVDSFPDRRFAGHITFIAREAEFTPSNVQTPEERSKQVFRIKVVLDEGRDVLRPGMAADVFLEPQE